MDSSSSTFYSTLSSLPTTAQTLLHHAGEQRVWCLEGPLGAGKTTLVRALCAQLGVQDNVTSPTFSLVQEYATASGTPVYHFDFYRLHEEEEAWALDCTTYFDSGSYCFIEWPSKVLQLLPPAHYQVHLTVLPDGCRQLQAHYP